MNWNYAFGLTEYLFIALFVMAYTAFFIRTVRVARQLSSTSRSLFIKFFVRSIAFTLLIISLLGPSFGEAEQEIKAEGKDIYLLVDLSKSMEATDVVPSRLDKVKFEINRLVQKAGSNRIGLIIFANEAYVQAPLTYDQAALDLFVQSLQTGLLPRHGTNLCSALELASQKILDEVPSSQKSKIMVLFTDGENDGSCNGQVYNTIRRYGLHVFIVGVGTLSGGTIPVDGEPLRDDDGDIVVTKLNPKGLQRIARQTNGSYYELNNKRNDLGRLLADLNALSGQVIDSRVVTVASNKYYYFLGIALLFLAIDVLITVRTFRL
ncbi:VWA domain-containing protein [Rhabdobacter roseus]|uniref:Ca-activated chloride channel family protein n=1 Tax=Rhabdobacter roseus TaxID=1655419 RepID=A0A840TI13_9BACT|nr:VWA domain-containing protein [Rhabdobacter roseus]MBB5283104.1 Ca-activated chloride channel family protein [Rhabdobacter roseus]